VADSGFINQFQHRALRHLPRKVRPLGMTTRLDIRPTRFALGLDQPVHWERLAEAHSAPCRTAFYLGRVKDVTEGDAVALLWEYPNGRESLTSLSVRRDFGGEPPAPGSLLRIWTWVELPGEGQHLARRKIEVKAPVLSEAARAELEAFLATLDVDGVELEADET
jgi:hypothetical protein